MNGQESKYTFVGIIIQSRNISIPYSPLNPENHSHDTASPLENKIGK